LGDEIGGSDQSRLKVYMEAVDLEAVDLEEVDLPVVGQKVVNLEVVDLEAVDRERGATGAETRFLGYLVIEGMLRIGYNKGPPRDEGLAGSGGQSMLGRCSHRCMQYSVYTVLGVDS
jgi:hypothetical protein